MKTTTVLLSAFLVFSAVFVFAQDKNVSPSAAKPLHKYIIEREIPGAGKLGEQELAGIAAQSCSTIKKMNENVQWLQSYVTDNKVYCVYMAENEDAIKQHAKLAGFPANKISEVKTIIDPTTSK